MTGSTQADVFRNQIETVFDRHFHLCDRSFEMESSVLQAGRFSIEVNTALAGHAHDRKSIPWDLLPKSFTMGHKAWFRYMRDSRILERVIARLRVGLTSHQN
jgi:hypothetical protein